VRFKRTKCLCKECPLEGRNKVSSLCDIERPSIVLIGEAPGREEDLEKKPFVGGAGKLLSQAVASAGIMWHSTYRMNVISCRPEDNDITTSDAEEAIRCCKPGFYEELDNLARIGARVVVPLGNTALHAVGLDGNIGKSRGSVYLDKKRKLVKVPTFHPSFILRGAFSEEPTWVADLRKARELSLKKYVPPKENFNLFPTVKDLKTFVDDVLDNDKLVAVDIETTGLNPYYGRIIVIGLAISGEDALVVPFTKRVERNGEFFSVPYWSNTEKTKVDKLLKKLLFKAKTMFQNAMFDIRFLEQNGYMVANCTEDTMLAHHAIHPELPHNLGYIVSIYGTTPYWKDVVLGSEEHMIRMADRVVRTYNARDCVVLHQIIGGLHEDLKDGETMKQYREWSIPLLRPLIDMTKRGLLVDMKRLEKYKRELTKNRNSFYVTLAEKYNLPEDFNFDSVDHVRMLIHGVRPKGEAKKQAEFQKYQENSKLRKDTKKYEELTKALRTYNSIEPLYQTHCGASSTDAEAMVSIARAASNRLETIGNLVRKGPAQAEEADKIKKLLRFIKLFADFSEVDKALTTYTKYPIAPDGRVHGEYVISGTGTGRLSARNPNMQNQTAESKKVFVNNAGRCFVGADYSNLELRVLAYLTMEPYLIEAFEAGLNIHDVNCKALWGIDESHPNWKELRRAAKTYVFGRNYGGTVEGIYRRLVAAQPELGLTLKRFTEMDRAYFAKMPNYTKWREKVIADALVTRTSVNAFGRKRLFLGTSDEISRECLNTPVQGTAGDIANAALIRIDLEFKKRPELAAYLVQTVHDSIVADCPLENKVEVAKIMKREMERPVKIEGIERVFPVDLEFGTYLYPMEKLDLGGTPCQKKRSPRKLSNESVPSPTTKTKRKTGSGSKTTTKTRSPKAKGSSRTSSTTRGALKPRRSR